MSLLEQQSRKRKERLEQLRNRNKKSQNNNNAEKIRANEEESTNEREPKSSPTKIISRNFNRETNLPVTAFTSPSLDLGNYHIELVDKDEEQEFLNDLSKKYNLDKDEDEENIDLIINDGAAKQKVKAASDMEKDLKDYEYELDLLTNKMIRKFVRERLAAEKNSNNN